MLQTIGTFALGALVAVFAVCAVFLNESEHAARRRLKRDRGRAPQPADAGSRETLDLSGEGSMPRDGRRLPVGDFLFGALFLRGEEPLPFGELAAGAADAGLDISQILAWLDRAEESGLVERVEDEDASQPAVRLTELGTEVARNNRRGARRPAAAKAAEGRRQGL
jgi:hypothetical protein